MCGPKSPKLHPNMYTKIGEKTNRNVYLKSQKAYPNVYLSVPPPGLTPNNFFPTHWFAGNKFGRVTGNPIYFFHVSMASKKKKMPVGFLFYSASQESDIAESKWLVRLNPPGRRKMASLPSWVIVHTRCLLLSKKNLKNQRPTLIFGHVIRTTHFFRHNQRTRVFSPNWTYPRDIQFTGFH